MEDRGRARRREEGSGRRIEMMEGEEGKGEEERRELEKRKGDEGRRREERRSGKNVLSETLSAGCVTCSTSLCGSSLPVGSVKGLCGRMSVTHVLHSPAAGERESVCSFAVMPFPEGERVRVIQMNFCECLRGS